MNSTLKRHIKLLAERYDHQIQYDRNVMIISNSSNTIRVEEHKKNAFDITYNISSTSTKTERISAPEIYDLIIKILTRYEIEEVNLKGGTPVTIEQWIDEECSNDTRVIDIKRRIKKEKSDHVFLGKNRLEAEYYKGILILTDDILFQPFNVIDFPLDE